MADKAEIISKARDITGNKPSVAVGETSVPDSAILAALDPIVRDLSRRYGDSGTSRQAVFDATAGHQDYPIASAVGADVFQIVSVMRSSAYTPDVLTDGDSIDPSTGLPDRRYGTVPAGGQGDVFDKIIQTRRRQRLDAFSWEVVRKADGDYLRLYPYPTSAEVVAVDYVTSGFDIDSLPDQTEACLVYAACVAIIDAHINRVMGERMSPAASPFGEAQAARLEVLRLQRDRYEQLYTKERDLLP